MGILSKRVPKDAIVKAKQWRAARDKRTGKLYYYHRETRETQWDKPAGFDEARKKRKAGKATQGSNSADLSDGSGDVVKDLAEPTTLFRDIQHKLWSSALQRAQEHPLEARTWIRKSSKGRTTWMVLPLHAAVVLGAPTDLIFSLVELYPEAVSRKDQNGSLPIHLAACSIGTYSNAEDAFKIFLRVYPDCRNVTDAKGHTPLELLNHTRRWSTKMSEQRRKRILDIISETPKEEERTVATAADSVISWSMLGASKESSQEPDAIRTEEEEEMTVAADAKSLISWSMLGASKESYQKPSAICTNEEDEMTVATEMNSVSTKPTNIFCSSRIEPPSPLYGLATVSEDADDETMLTYGLTLNNGHAGVNKSQEENKTVETEMNTVASRIEPALPLYGLAKTVSEEEEEDTVKTYGPSPSNGRAVDGNENPIRDHGVAMSVLAAASMESSGTRSLQPIAYVNRVNSEELLGGNNHVDQIPLSKSWSMGHAKSKGSAVGDDLAEPIPLDKRTSSSVSYGSTGSKAKAYINYVKSRLALKKSKSVNLKSGDEDQAHSCVEKFNSFPLNSAQDDSPMVSSGFGNDEEGLDQLSALSGSIGTGTIAQVGNDGGGLDQLSASSGSVGTGTIAAAEEWIQEHCQFSHQSKSESRNEASNEVSKEASLSHSLSCTESYESAVKEVAQAIVAQPQRTVSSVSESVSDQLSLEDDVDSPTTLYLYLHQRDWAMALNRLSEHPEEANVWVWRKARGYVIWRFLPLHAAIVLGAPSYLVLELMNAYPNACQKRDMNGSLPIHLAATRFAAGASDGERIVNHLRRAFPDSAHIPDGAGQTCLDIMKASGKTVDDDDDDFMVAPEEDFMLGCSSKSQAFDEEVKNGNSGPKGSKAMAGGAITVESRFTSDEMPGQVASMIKSKFDHEFDHMKSGRIHIGFKSSGDLLHSNTM